MTWLLILTLTADGQSMDMPAAVTADERICVMAGAGISRILQDANPGLTATWTCRRLGEAA